MLSLLLSPIVASLAVFAQSTYAAPRSAAASATNRPLSTLALSRVRSLLAQHSTDSWVSGTRTEALLESDYASLSVFSPSVFSSSPRGTTPTSTNQIIASWSAIRPANAVQMVQTAGGAAGDPASLGVAWILAQQTASDATVAAAYESVIEQELAYLINVAPRTADGAISHRAETVQLWADFVYMVPPFLAFYGATHSNATILREAYRQCALYRQHLRDPSTGLWRHIVLGSWQDNGLWGTGNAWAAAGMTRVLATIKHSPLASQFTSEMSDLTRWANEILNAAFPHLGDSLLPNYYGSTNTFSDSSSSALLAATAYRLAYLKCTAGSTYTLAQADRIRTAIQSHVASTGWLAPVVNPLAWTINTNQSPEGQAFVLLLEAAWNDWRAK